MMPTSRKGRLLVLASVMLMMMACAEMTIQNNTQYPVRVVVSLPGTKGSRGHFLGSSSTIKFVSPSEGNYLVNAIIDEYYLNKMDDLKSRMQNMIINFDDASWSPGEFGKTIDDIIEIDRFLTSVESTQCSGRMTEDVTTEVTIEQSAGTNPIIAICP
ncbi:hypothetical protein ACFLXB_00660 [Chloroflexota bacterium]